MWFKTFLKSSLIFVFISLPSSKFLNDNSFCFTISTSILWTLDKHLIAVPININSRFQVKKNVKYERFIIQFGCNNIDKSKKATNTTSFSMLAFDEVFDAELDARVGVLLVLLTIIGLFSLNKNVTSRYLCLVKITHK